MSNLEEQLERIAHKLEDHKEKFHEYDLVIDEFKKASRSLEDAATESRAYWKAAKVFTPIFLFVVLGFLGIQNFYELPKLKETVDNDIKELIREQRALTTELRGKTDKILERHNQDISQRLNTYDDLFDTRTANFREQSNNFKKQSGEFQEQSRQYRSFINKGEQDLKALSDAQKIQLQTQLDELKTTKASVQVLIVKLTQIADQAEENLNKLMRERELALHTSEGSPSIVSLPVNTIPVTESSFQQLFSPKSLQLDNGWAKEGYEIPLAIDGPKLTVNKVSDDVVTYTIKDKQGNLLSESITTSPGHTDMLEIDGQFYNVKLNKIDRAGFNPFTKAGYFDVTPVNMARVESLNVLPSPDQSREL